MMAGLIRSKEEGARQDGFLSRAVPSVDVQKLAVYNDGKWAYPLTALSPKERKAMNAAGYRYSGNCWYRQERPALRLIK